MAIRLWRFERASLRIGAMIRFQDVNNRCCAGCISPRTFQQNGGFRLIIANMLSWLAGQRPAEIVSDVDSTTYMEPPETPAPVFAVRAFKQAIFGTPQPGDNSSKPSHAHSKRTERSHQPSSRPSHSRRGSEPVMNTLTQMTEQQEVLTSPTKPNGILMTPGTAATRRKTVSFGADTLDNEGKRPMFASKSGLPNDFPGKYPSPWTQKTGDTGFEITDEEGRGRTPLTEQLYQVRDSSTKASTLEARREKDKRLKPIPWPSTGRDGCEELDSEPKAKAGRKEKAQENPSKTNADNDLTMDYLEPKSQSGKYWKGEYDSYVSNTKREMKKLVAKQQAAKGYARDKDAQATELMDRLRQERKNVDRLETRNAELSAQIREMQEQLRIARDERTRAGRENSPAKRPPSGTPDLSPVHVVVRIGPDGEQTNRRSPPKFIDTRRDSLELSSNLPKPSPERMRSSPTGSQSPERRVHQPDNVSISFAAPLSPSQQQQLAMANMPLRPIPKTRSDSYNDSEQLQARLRGVATAQQLGSWPPPAPLESKENVSPTFGKSSMAVGGPSQQTEKRTASLVSRDGRDMNAARFAEAEARIEARKKGRNAS